MTMFMFGIALLWIGLGDRFWELVGWAPEEDEAQGRITIRSWTKLFASLVGLILFVYAFPGLAPVYMSAPGWVAMGVILLVPGIFDFPWQQEMFKTMMDDDYDYKSGYGILRVILIILAALCIGVGVGDGDPSDNGRGCWSKAQVEKVEKVEQVK